MQARCSLLAPALLPGSPEQAPTLRPPSSLHGRTPQVEPSMQALPANPASNGQKEHGSYTETESRRESAA